MFDFRDLFQWERFITPSIIKIFYWLAVGISVLFGLSGIVSGLTLMALSPLGGLFWIIASLIGVVIVTFLLTRALPGDAAERFFAVGFALEQMRQNFRDLVRVVDEWGPAQRTIGEPAS